MSLSKNIFKDGINQMTMEHSEELKHTIASVIASNHSFLKYVTVSRENLLKWSEKIICDHLASQERTRALYGNGLTHCNVLKFLLSSS